VVILGVDPGSLRTGYGAIESDGRRHRLIEAGVLASPRRLALPERLRLVHEGLRGVIERLRPQVLAVEDVFHAVNTRSALVLGHVRGVVLLCGAESGLAVSAFPPATVKVQVTGYGAAEKTQVALMVARLLELPRETEAGDASDALAVALCHAHLGPLPVGVALAVEALVPGGAALPVGAPGVGLSIGTAPEPPPLPKPSRPSRT
jgi:crossover junction endodeoxyribonuclease RuvC